MFSETVLLHDVKGGNRLSVLALVTDAWNGRGGIAQYNRDLLGALAAQPGVESIRVLARHVPDSGEQMPPNVFMSGPHGKLQFVFAALWLAANMKRPFVIFCGHINFAPLARFLSRFYHTPAWLQVHGIEAWNRPGRIAAGAVERMHLVTAVSRYTRSRLLSWAALQPARVKVLPNTVSERFSPGPKRQDLLERLGLERKNILVTVARLSAQERYKGHDLVIEAMPKLLADDPDMRYLIVGDGNDRKRLEGLAQENGVSKQVMFAGAVSHKELPDFYRLADVFVMPSTGEGFGIAFLEAAASGALVIGCGVDGSVDALREGDLGAIASPTAQGVTGAIKDAFAEPARSAGDTRVFQRVNFNRRAGLMLSINA